MAASAVEKVASVSTGTRRDKLNDFAAKIGRREGWIQAKAGLAAEAAGLAMDALAAEPTSRDAMIQNTLMVSRSSYDPDAHDAPHSPPSDSDAVEVCYLP